MSPMPFKTPISTIRTMARRRLALAPGAPAPTVVALLIFLRSRSKTMVEDGGLRTSTVHGRRWSPHVHSRASDVVVLVGR